MSSRRLPAVNTADLGKLGESTLDAFCSQASMVSNPAKLDVLGFDNLVQIEFEEELPAHDLGAPPMRAFIQVKATQSRARRIPIRLTNWKKMIRDRDPWFVLICEVSAQRDVADVYVVHINETWIEKALRKLRNHSPKKKLGKTTLLLTYCDDDRLPKIHGSALRQRLLDGIGSDIEAYREKKERFHKTCGYDGETQTMQVTFPDKEVGQHHADWIDVALGLRSDLDIKHLRVTDNRFGESVVTLDAPGSVLTMKVRPTQTAHLRLYNANAGNIGVQAEIFSTAVIPHIPAELSKARVKIGPLSLLIDTGKRESPAGNNVREISCSASWDFNEHCALSRMGEAARAMVLLTTLGTQVSLELSNPDGTSLDLQVHNLPPPNPAFERFLKTVWAVSIVAKRAGLDTLELAPPVFERIPLIALLAASILEGTSDTLLTFPPQIVDSSKKPVLVMACAFAVPKWAFFVCGMLPGRSMGDPMTMNFTTEGGRCLGIWKTPIQQAKKFPIKDRHAEWVARLQEDPSLQVFWIKPGDNSEYKTLRWRQPLDTSDSSILVPEQSVPVRKKKPARKK